MRLSHPVIRDEQLSRKKRVVALRKDMAHKEDDTGFRSSCFGEEFSDGSLGFSHEFVQELKVLVNKSSVVAIGHPKERNTAPTSGPRTARKLTPLSVASALPTMVLLHPGGP